MDSLTAVFFFITRSIHLLTAAFYVKPHAAKMFVMLKCSQKMGPVEGSYAPMWIKTWFRINGSWIKQATNLMSINMKYDIILRELKW